MFKLRNPISGSGGMYVGGWGAQMERKWSADNGMDSWPAPVSVALN